MSGRFEVRITHRAEKDIKKLTQQLKRKLHDILTEVIAQDPFQGKRLFGDLAGSYSYRLTYHDRIVYSVDVKDRVVYIERAATHYGE
ncbi:MAG: type II toxin-antitoxin system RelE/ParE family toxin [Candidatus Omnitrophica bacterium]|nr:type II toxin-antitoxin system RelE/ParE family toxin [Candidatus Omnitrophota bacterium]